MKYTPAPMPSNTQPALQVFLTRELNKIAQSVESEKQKSEKDSNSLAFFLGHD